MFEFKLSALAAERIEEHFNLPLDEIFNQKLKAADVGYILWSMALTDMELPEFKVELAKHYTYGESIELITKTLDPNGLAAQTATTTDVSNTPQF